MKLIILHLVFQLLFLNKELAAQGQPGIESLVKKRCCLGWREWVTLPSLFKERVIAKVDSGAKTSTLHAENIEIFEKEGEEWARFVVYPKRDSKKVKHSLEARVVETKNIRSSTGRMTIRPVIKTILAIGGERWPIELTLVDRSVMGYRMLMGRTAFQSKFLVDSGKSFIVSEKRASEFSDVSRDESFVKKLTSLFGKKSTARNVFQTTVAFLTIFILRYMVLWTFSRQSFHSPAARKMFVVYSRNVSVAIFLIALFVIWFSQFKSVSIYLMAISVAVVLSMKEIIQNLHGGFLLTSSRPFRIGDRIDIKKVRGDVLDTNFMTTKIAEVGSNGEGSDLNGRVTTLPNSMFLDAPIVNETSRHTFSPHSLVYPTKEDSKWKVKEEAFLEIIDRESSEYFDEAERYFKSLDESEMIVGLSCKPSVSYSFPSPGRIDLTFRFVVPTARKGDIETKIKRAFLEKMLK